MPECNADLIAVTKTWLKEIDDAVRAEVKPTGYKLANVPRPNRRGGGTALFYRESINVSKHIMLKLRPLLSSPSGK